MLQVGIHKGVVISKVSKNEKGTLEIDVTKGGSASFLDMFNSTSDSSSQKDENNSFKLFNPLTTNNFGTDLTLDQIKTSITQFRDKLNHILLGYLAAKDITVNVFKGIEFKSEEDLYKKFMNQETLDIIYDNIVNDFIENMKKADLSQKFTVKLVRQSKAKHFAKFPDSKFGYSGKNAFWEPSELEEQSKVMYSQYEKNNGLDNPNAGAADAVSSEPSGSSDLPF